MQVCTDFVTYLSWLRSNKTTSQSPNMPADNIGAVCIQLTHLSYDDSEHTYYFILSSSSNQKYDSFAIV